MNKHKGKIYYDKYCRIFKRNDEEIDMILDIGEKNFELYSKYGEYFSREKISVSNLIEFEEKIKKLEKEIEDEKLITEKIKEKNLEELEFERNNAENWRKQYNDLQIKQQTIIDDKISEKETHFNKIKNMTEENYKLQLSNLENKLNYEIINLRHEIKNGEKNREELEQELEGLRKEYGISKEKSDLRGSDFEKCFFNQLSIVLKKNGIWSLKKCTHEKGKGDFLLINNFTDYRIMVELKHMKNVSATNENQQPKFIRDLTSEENNYDAGIMIASGDIVGKTNYQTDIIQGKIAYYISNYKMDDIKLFMVSLKFIFDMIKSHKSTEFFDFEDAKREFLKKYKVFYETSSRMKTLYETFEKNRKDLCNYIWETYNIDPDEYMRKTIREEKRSGAKLEKTLREEEIIETIRSELNLMCEKADGTISKQQILKTSAEMAAEAIENKELRKTRLTTFTKNYYKDMKDKKIKSISNAKTENIKIDT
jgi:hypothetical protein